MFSSASDHRMAELILLLMCAGLADHSVVREEGLLSSLQEGIQVIENAIRELQWTQLCYFSISSAIVIGLALLYFFSELPYLYSSSFQVALVLLIPVSIFTLIMATVWNKIEQNGLRSSKMGMQFLAERVSSAGTDVYNASSTSDDRFIWYTYNSPLDWITGLYWARDLGYTRKDPVWWLVWPTCLKKCNLSKSVPRLTFVQKLSVK